MPKNNGGLFVLDHNEFSYKEMPACLKIPFTTWAAPYAFSFIEGDWKRLLQQQGFAFCDGHHVSQSYVQLLTARRYDGHFADKELK